MKMPEDERVDTHDADDEFAWDCDNGAADWDESESAPQRGYVDTGDF